MREPCTQPDCERPSVGRGLCSKHYQRAKYHGEFDEPDERTCEQCGQSFTGRRWGSLYCSLRCNDAARYQRKREAKGYRAEVCEQCGESLPADRRLDVRFCSTECGDRSNNRQRGRALSERRREARMGRICANSECGQPIPADRTAAARYCSKECQRTNPEMRAYQRAINKRRLYGMSMDMFQDLLDRQGGRCAICSTDVPRGTGDFHVDHDHATGRVRGLLCNACNIGLGHFKDDIELLRAAVRYLE